MTHDEIRQLIQLAQETGVAELEVQRGENRVRVKLGMVATEAVVPVVAAVPQASTARPGTDAPTAVPAGDPTLELVKSPIVGTFYESASPDLPPFVKIGDQVRKGQVLCIIESMKLMNEIESEMNGTVVSKLVENGRPVEYGEAMFALLPA